MNVVLVMFRENGERRSFSLSRDVTLIGRREDADFRIPLTDVSRKHCRLIKDGNILLMEDLGSSNGTYHNGRRVQEAEISPGDTLRIGPVQFVVQIDGMPSDGELVGSGASALIDSSATMITPGTSIAPPPPPPPGFSSGAGSQSGFELNQPTIDDRSGESAVDDGGDDRVSGFDSEDDLASDDAVPSEDAEVVAESAQQPAGPSKDDADPLADLESLADHDEPAAADSVQAKVPSPPLEQDAGPVSADHGHAGAAEPAAEDAFQFIDDARGDDEDSPEDDVMIDFDLPDDRKKD